jgi:uncharacterized protein
MKFRIDDIKASPKRRRYDEDAGELNARLADAGDYRVPDPLHVDVEYYRAGLDLFFQGDLRGGVVARCGRCLEEYPIPVAAPFRVVLTPRAATGAEPDAADDTTVATYEGEEIDLAPFVYEEVLLGLPTRPLCREDCEGLCPRCGGNRNVTRCDCRTDIADPRLAVLHELTRGK